MLIVRFSYVFMLLSIFAIFIMASSALAESSEDFASTAIRIAEGSIISAYEAVLEVEKAGGDVSDLCAQLNEAEELLAAARTSYRNEDFDNAPMFANLSRNLGVEVMNATFELKDSASNARAQHMRFTMFVSISGVVLVVIGSLWVWRVLKRVYQ